MNFGVDQVTNIYRLVFALTCTAYYPYTNIKPLAIWKHSKVNMQWYSGPG